MGMRAYSLMCNRHSSQKVASSHWQVAFTLKVAGTCRVLTPGFTDVTVQGALSCSNFHETIHGIARRYLRLINMNATHGANS